MAFQANAFQNDVTGPIKGFQVLAGAVVAIVERITLGIKDAFAIGVDPGLGGRGSF